jgi:hypothetical protein
MTMSDYMSLNERVDAVKSDLFDLREEVEETHREASASYWAERRAQDAKARRERIATACLVGLLASPHYDYQRVTIKEDAKNAIIAADALIAELDKPAPAAEVQP